VALAGQVVTDAAARGKHLLLRFTAGRTLRSHLGMHGSWHRYAAGGPPPRVRGRASIVLAVVDLAGEEIFACYNAMEVEWLVAGGDREHAFGTRVGDDLLGTGTDIPAIVSRTRALLPADALLVDVLLDQRVAAGIGNVYKSELLFLARLPPTTTLGAVGDGVLTTLYTDAQQLLAANLGSGPRTTRTASDGAGRLWVYNRGGRPCHRCRAPIWSARLGARPRGTWWCPRCQPARN
jgi:endonuclease-8